MEACYVLLNPPLIASFFTLPLLGMNLPEPPIMNDLPTGERTYDNLEFQGGKALVFQNDTNAILFRTRMTAMVFTVVLALLVFAAAREMFGVGAGLIALSLMAFDLHSWGIPPSLLWTRERMPHVLGNLRFLPVREVTDGVAADRYRLIVGLALAAKHSAILLFPTMGVLAIIEVVCRGKLEFAAPPVRAGRQALRLALALAVIFAISMTILWAPTASATLRATRAFNPPMQTQLDRVPSALEGRLLGEIDRLHLLPAPYTYAFANILSQAKSYTSYLMGVAYRTRSGSTSPLPCSSSRASRFSSCWLSAPVRSPSARSALAGDALHGISAVVFMAFAVTGGMNIGVRHILPVYVFLFVPIAGQPGL